MKLWATRDSGDPEVDVWFARPVNHASTGRYVWSHCSGFVITATQCLALFGRLPRRDRPMRVTLTGKVTK